MDWREKVTNVSEKVFPGLSFENPHKGNEVMSSLPLQMSLYFNVIFFPIWLLIMANYLVFEFECLRDLQKFVLITIIISAYVVETVRLYLGYEGNLKDKISELAAFWLLSLLLQVPLESILLMNPYFRWKVIDFVAHVIMFILLLIEVVAGYLALRNIARHQAIMHRIFKLNDIEFAQSYVNKTD